MSETSLDQPDSNLNPINFDLEKLVIPEDEYKDLVKQLRNEALTYAQQHNAKEWLTTSLKDQRFLDGIVSEMRHFDNGQLFILDKLKKLKPDLEWFRGGTISTWRDYLGHSGHFSPEELETLTIDGGSNGALGRPEIAINFLKITPRIEPVIYSLGIAALEEGLKKDAVFLVSEHGYDLRVIPGKDRRAYLEFCKTHLNIDSADPNL